MAFPTSPSVGDTYTIGTQEYTFNGSAWDLSGSGIANNSNRYTYTATSSQTEFNADYITGYIDVYVNGIKLLDGSDFTATNGTTVVMSQGLSTGDIVDIVAYGTFDIADTYTQSQTNGLLDAKADANVTYTETEVDNLLDAKVNTSAIGTAAASDVTTSSTDTTAGRLLKVGDFGVGSAISYDSNLDDITKAGFYRILDGVSNNPSGTNGLGDMMFVQKFQQDIYIQQYYSYTANKVFFRRRTGTWFPWQEIYHTGNAVGTVSQSGGVPTGAIIERGSNANGEYTKFADGTMICRASSFSGNVSSAGGFDKTITLPATFSSTDYSYAFTQTISHGDANYGRSLVWRYGIQSTSQLGVRVWPDDNIGSTAAAVYFCSIFIGRWY